MLVALVARLWSGTLPVSVRVSKMADKESQVQRPARADGQPVRPLVKKTSSLLPGVKERLSSALSDMKKSVVNLKKSPWLLSRSSMYSSL